MVVRILSYVSPHRLAASSRCSPSSRPNSSVLWYASGQSSRDRASPCALAMEQNGLSEHGVMTTFEVMLVRPQRRRMPEVLTSPAPKPLSRVAAPDVLTCAYLALIGLLATVFAERIPQWWWYPLTHAMILLAFAIFLCKLPPTPTGW